MKPAGNNISDNKKTQNNMTPLHVKTTEIVLTTHMYSKFSFI